MHAINQRQRRLQIAHRRPTIRLAAQDRTVELKRLPTAGLMATRRRAIIHKHRLHLPREEFNDPGWQFSGQMTAAGATRRLRLGRSLRRRQIHRLLHHRPTAPLLQPSLQQREPRLIRIDPLRSRANSRPACEARIEYTTRPTANDRPLCRQLIASAETRMPPRASGKQAAHATSQSASGRTVRELHTNRPPVICPVSTPPSCSTRMPVSPSTTVAVLRRIFARRPTLVTVDKKYERDKAHRWAMNAAHRGGE